MRLGNLLILVNLVHFVYTAKKFNEFLTDDNELSPIEIKSKSNNKKNNNNNNITPGSKLIVNVLYQQKGPKPKLDTHKNSIVYSTLDTSSGPCDKNVCKSNQVCIKRPEKKKPFECVNKVNKKKREVSTTKKTTTIKKKRNVVLSKNCTHIGLTFLKINLFEMFDSLKEEEKKQIDKINAIEFSCPEAVCRLFSQLDFNHNRNLDKLEWSKLTEYTTDACLNDLGNICDLDGDNLISFDEFCSCFQGIKSKCMYTRFNQDTRKAYIDLLNLAFKSNKTLSLSNYAPICDHEGYFVSTQCDSKVTCWCVRKNGDFIEHSLSGINQTPKDCKQFS
ncbi:unnamed protein product [Brachionus calyciflorus]|uniref:Uncharacterized protein n=1 Tax=Brachionus calyciflorus TaxID=104777 RepID=A0A813RQV4_9BILA|nr:unnamed protein product [Brachionus calyciflorus]